MLDTWRGPEWSRASYKNVFWNVENISNSHDRMITILFKKLQSVNISAPYIWNVSAVHGMYAVVGKDWNCLLLFNKWQFYHLPCTVWTWTLDNVHTYFCDILRATLKLNLTWGRTGNTKQLNRGCWQHGTFLTFMWAVLILGCADHFPTITFWTMNWHTSYFNPAECSHQFRVFISPVSYTHLTLPTKRIV